jgi:hypothetical protein
MKRTLLNLLALCGIAANVIAGEEIKLKDPILIAGNKEDCKALIEGSQDGDTNATKEMVSAGRAVVLPPGTVIFLEDSGPTFARIRVEGFSSSFFTSIHSIAVQIDPSLK